jgi:hypothetical protein
MRTQFTLVSILALPLLACGGGGGATADAPHAGSCVAASTYSATPTMQGADDAVDPPSGSGSDGSDDGDETLEYDGNVDATTVLDIQLWSGTTDYPGGTVGPETSRDLSGSADAQLETCGTCVQLFAGIGSDGNPTETYLATSGSLTVTSTTGSFTGTLTNVKLVEIMIDDDGVSSPDASGCTSEIASMTFSGAITEDNGSAAVTAPRDTSSGL